MKLFYDTRLGYLVSAPGQDSALAGFNVKSGDTEQIVIQFGQSSDPTSAQSIVTAPTWTAESRLPGTVIKLALKADGMFSDGESLASTSSFIHDSENKLYTFDLNLNTTAINTALLRADDDDANDIELLTAGFEITFQEGGTGGWRSSVEPCPVTIYHDIIEGDEGTPALADNPAEYLLRQDAVIYLPTVNRITGGTATDFDALVTTALSGSANYAYQFNDEDASPDTLRAYRLETGTDAENIPDIIRPLDYNASTNPKIWRLLKNSTGLSQVVEDVGPQLGGNLDANGYDILFDSGDGIRDAAGAATLLFASAASAVNSMVVHNASAATYPSFRATGTGTVGIDFTTLGSGPLRVNGNVVPAPASPTSGQVPTWNGSIWVPQTPTGTGRWIAEGVSAAEMTPATTAGCAPLAVVESTTYDNNFQVLAFDQSTAENAWGTFLLPDDWDDSTSIKAKIYWRSTATGNVLWKVGGRGNLDTFDTDISTSLTSIVDTASASGSLYTTDATGAISFVNIPTVAIEARRLAFVVRREAADGSDTSAGDAQLISIAFQLYVSGDAAAW